MSSSQVLGLLLVLAAGVHPLTAAKLPDFVPTCKRDVPDFDQCIRNSIEAVRPHLAKGIPKLKVPPIEPLVIPALEINRNTEALQIKAKLKDIKAYGGSGFVIDKLKTNVDKLALDTSVTIPHLQVSADYDVDGRMLVLPLKGKGIFHGNFSNVKADVRATGKMIKNKKGVQFVQVKDIQVKIAVGDQKVRFINKSGKETEALTQTAMNFYNQNRQQVLGIVMPIVEETVIAFMRQFANTIMKTVPFSEIVPN